ncbi:MAG: type I-C CRISPR-associated protein Cas5 [Desulfarculus sp.]|nr:type I-C CRISPR-associated protein Cas5 [Desulfarculus sp.]
MTLEDKWRQVRLKVWGEHALFTRPEMKVERVSYDIITPAAARAILEAILWKPAIRWSVTGIDLLAPIRHGRSLVDEQSWDMAVTESAARPLRTTSVRRNEVGAVASTDNAIAAMRRGSGNLGLYVEDERQQRAAQVLIDVAYLIHAQFELTPQAGPEDTVQKFSEMFRRRAAKGQCHHRPYLGCREFAAHFALVEHGQDSPQPLPLDHDLGWMFYDFAYDQGRQPHFFRAELKKGSLTVPPWESLEVRA